MTIFSSKEFILVSVLIGLSLLMIIVVFCIDRKPRIKKISKNEEESLEPILEDKSQEITELEAMLEPTVESLPVEPAVTEPQQEEIKYVDETKEKTEAQLELQRLTEELKQQEEKPINIELTNFEQEQEEQAIISLDELLKKGEALYEQNEVVQYEDEGNEPINLMELEQRILKQKEETAKVVLDDFATAKEESIKQEEPKKFKSSPVISPVYGIEENNVVKDQTLELENTANYDKLDEEIRKTNEFLQILKELQKKLD